MSENSNQQEENFENNNTDSPVVKVEKKGGKEMSALLAFVAVLVLALAFFVMAKGKADDNTVGVDEEALAEAEESKIFENIDLESEAVFVWDIKNQKEIYSKNAEAQLPLASITKVLMAITALDRVPEGTMVTIKDEDLYPEGDSGLYANETWTLKDLVEFSLVVSSNDGANAIASAIGSQVSGGSNGIEEFIRLMNLKSREIGLDQTYFTSPSGLDKGDIVPGGNGSARDVATLFEYAFANYPEVLEATSYPSLSFSSDFFKHEAENTNSLVSKLPGIVGSKTGFTDLAGGNLAVVIEPEPGRPIVLVALGSSIEGRFSDIEKLYLTTLEYINPKQ